jgi:hypothetical protein
MFPSIWISWATVGCGEKEWSLSSARIGRLKFIQIPFMFSRTSLRWLEEGDEVSKELTDIASVF